MTDMWKARVADAARATMATCDAVSSGIVHRPSLFRAVQRACADADELKHVDEIVGFTPTPSWRARWMQDLNASAGELGSLIFHLKATDDPLREVVHTVAVCVAHTIALMAELTCDAPPCDD